MMKRIVVLAAVAALVVFGAASCGGGNGNGGNGNGNNNGGTHSHNGQLSALTWSEAAAQVAYLHSVDMGMNGYFDHTNPGGESPSDRVANAGITHDPGVPGIIPPNFAGENLFWQGGQVPTGQDAVTSWVNSPGHHAQIDAPLLAPGASQTMPAWTHVGVGVYVQGNQAWVTAVFLRNPSGGPGATGMNAQEMQIAQDTFDGMNTHRAQ